MIDSEAFDIEKVIRTGCEGIFFFRISITSPVYFRRYWSFGLSVEGSD